MHLGKWAGLLAALALCGCSPQQGSGSASVSVEEAAKGAAEMEAKAKELGSEAKPNKASNWSYDSDRDEMRDTTTYYATVNSESEVNVGFPYDAAKASITIRKRPSDGLSVLLQAPGQFLCRSYADDTIAVKFDDGPIQRFPCGEPSDASTGLLFIRSSARFVDALKKARRVIIEVEMYQAGAQQMTFQVEGLEWPPKPS